MEEVKKEKCVVTRRKWMEETEELTVRVPRKAISCIQGAAKLSGRTFEEVAQQCLMYGYEHLDIER